MTVKMSSDGDSAKNLSSETNQKTETPNSNSTQESKDSALEAEKVDNKVNDTPKQENCNSDKKKDVPKASDDEKATDIDSKDKVDAKGDKKDAESSNEEKNDTVKDKEKAKDKKAESEDSEKEEDESGKEEEEDEAKEKPLLDQPLEKSGKRDRKNVTRYNEEYASEPKENTKVEIPNGSGTALGGIPRIDASISRFKNDDLKLLHKVLFKIPGKTTMVKKNIKLFCGFDFKKNSDEYSKKLASLKKVEVKHLKSICEMLDLAKSGTKDDIVDRVLDFLMEPKDSGKPVGGGRPKRTAAVRANNRGYSSHDNYSSDERQSGRTTRDKGKRANLKEDSSSASDEDFEPSDDGSDEKPRANKRKRSEKKKIESEEEEEDVSDVESPSSEEDSDDEPQSKRKNTRANNKSKAKVGRRGRKPAAKKTPNKAGRKKNKETSEEEEEEEESEHKDDGSSSEDEPLAKKVKSTQPPTDDEIKDYVKEILEGANLEQITMKTVCQKVYAHYPDFDLAHKKDFIKTTVKSLIST